MNIAIIGAGHVGLVTGVGLSKLGNQVICVDNNEEKIDRLKAGLIPIYEPGLQDLIEESLHSGRLAFTTDLTWAVECSDIIMITVGTPALPTGNVDLTAMNVIMEDIAKNINSYKLIVVKSTVPVGTTEYFTSVMTSMVTGDISFDMVSNPEFLREGSAVNDMLQPDRIVIGSRSEKAFETLSAVYAPLEAPILKVDIRSAEMIKYASNAFLATKISFINEIANLCDKLDVDVLEVATAMGYDHRIGPHFLNAGVGYGGSCFPKDTAAFIQTAEHVNYDFKLLKAVQAVNENQRFILVDKLISVLGPLTGLKIAVLGLAFKPNTDDIRESASLGIIKILQDKQVNIKAYDPLAMEQAKQLYPDVQYCISEYEAVRDCDAVLILTEWPDFARINWKQAGTLMKRKVVLDGRNMLDPKLMVELGFISHSMGRSKVGGC